MKKLLLLALAVLMLAVLLGGFLFLRRQLNIDDCLDGGGRWDYANEVCDQ